MKTIKSVFLTFLLLNIFSSAQNTNQTFNLQINAFCLSPFVDCNWTNKIYSGIEYKLVEVIANKLKLNPIYNFFNKSNSNDYWNK